MTHGSLFSGGGGFDLAAQWAGWTNVFNCEIEPFCKRILKYYWPDAIQYDDIRKTDFTVWRGRIDVLSGGFPCQPFSQAGKRKGTEDERHLWPEMLRAIREIRPRWVVPENVRGIITWSDGMVFEQVCADLEAEGYEVQPYLLPAAGVGATHERYRTWFIAHLADAGIERVREREDGVLSAGVIADTDSDDAGRRRYGETGCKAGTHKSEQEERKRFRYNIKRTCSKGVTPDADGRRLWGEVDGFGESGFFNETCPANLWQDFPTQSPVCSRDDELSGRLDSLALLDGRKPRQPWHAWSKWRQESIKLYGNAVVPYLVYQLFDTINQYEAL